MSPRDAHFRLPRRPLRFVLILLLALTSPFPAAGQQAAFDEDPPVPVEQPPSGKPGV